MLAVQPCQPAVIAAAVSVVAILRARAGRRVSADVATSFIRRSCDLMGLDGTTAAAWELRTLLRGFGGGASVRMATSGAAMAACHAAAASLCCWRRGRRRPEVLKAPRHEQRQTPQPRR